MNPGEPWAQLHVPRQTPAPVGSPILVQSDSWPADVASEQLGVSTVINNPVEANHVLSLDHLIHGSHRAYTQADLDALNEIRDQVVTGRTTASAAAMVNAGLTPTPAQLCLDLLAATQDLDATKIAEVLSHSVWLHGPPATIEDVVMPALREIGSRWSRGECDVAHERLATTTIEYWLQIRCQTARPPAHTAVVVLSCGPSEEHTLGLAALAALLMHHGVASVNLGARTPANTLRTATHHAKASAVVLTAQLNVNRPATVAALRTVQDTSTDLYYAGAAFRTLASRRGVPGTYLGGSLTNAATHLATRLKP